MYKESSARGYKTILKLLIKRRMDYTMKSRKETIISNVLTGAFIITIFIIAFFITWNFFKILNKPLNESQLEACEQVAYDVYAQGDVVLVDVPEGFSVEKTISSIAVQPNTNFQRGKVVAEIQNGELVITRDTKLELDFDTLMSICILGFLLGFGILTIIAIKF